MAIKTTIIFGREACRVYDETNDDIRAVKSFIKKDFGEIKTIEFATKEEQLAYFQGMEDVFGWEDYQIVE